MKFICIIILPLFFTSCSNCEKSIVSKRISEKKLKEDFLLFQNLIFTLHGGAFAYNESVSLSKFFDSISNSITEDLTVVDFSNKIEYAIDKIGCLHTSVDFDEDFYTELNKEKAFFEIPLIDIDDSIFINTNNYNSTLGSKVISINGIPAKKIINDLKIYKHVDGTTTQKKEVIGNNFALLFYLKFGPQKTFSLKYIDDTTQMFNERVVEAQTLKTINKQQDDETYFALPTEPGYDFKFLEKDKTALLRLHSLSYPTYATEEAYTNFMDNTFTLIRDYDVRNLIIDLRNNSGGYYYETYYLCGFLINKTLKEYDSCTKRYNELSFIKYLSPDDTSEVEGDKKLNNQFLQQAQNNFYEKPDSIDSWQPNRFIYKGKIFLLINNSVASAASHLSQILKANNRNVVIIGESTSGSSYAHNASVFTYVLPNSNLKIGIPTKRYYQSKTKNTKEAVEPNIEVKLTKNAIINNEDIQLNYILDSLIK